jgi:hypothetical protein
MPSLKSKAAQYVRTYTEMHMSWSAIIADLDELTETEVGARDRYTRTADELEASGQLDRLLRSGARFVEQAMVLDAARTGEMPATTVRRISPALLFERLWAETGCQSVITALARRLRSALAARPRPYLHSIHPPGPRTPGC